VSITAIARNDIEKEYIMSGMGDKLKGKGNEIKGNAKQGIGQQTNDPDMVAEGQGITGEVEGEAEKLLKEKMKG